MSGIAIALGILSVVCLHAAFSTHRAGCDKRDTGILAGLGISSALGSTFFFV
ncbi:hypothetical protein [Achromobacter spanius]|uniref:hypothetical protein n=1 Tax=Achromobacter spanius TaxID=217203 RepID=UPI003800AD85